MSAELRRHMNISSTLNLGDNSSWFYMEIIKKTNQDCLKKHRTKNEQIRKLQIWSHLLKKSFMENFIFVCSVS